MKYNKLSQCLIAALCSMAAFTSCSDDIMSSKTEGEHAEMTFKAVIESPVASNGSRCYIGERYGDYSNICWELGDQIAVGKDLSCFTSTSGGSRETEFTGGALTFTPGEDLYAFYPNYYYHPDPDDDEWDPLPYGYIEIPKEQDWNWSYAEHAQMIAKLKDGVFKFKPTCALIKVRLDKTMDKCTQIVVKSEDGTGYLSGQFEASFDHNGNVSLYRRIVNSKVQAYHSVTMSYLYGYLTTNWDIYIAVAPVTVNKLVMEFHTDNGVITKTSASKKTFECGEIWDGGIIDINGDEVDISNGHDYVDLGLPSGTKWATMNVGATSVEEYGDYFAWAETEPYYKEGYAYRRDITPEYFPSSLGDYWKEGKTNGYQDSSNKYYDNTNNTWTKYNDTDKKTVLDLEDDAANVNWGGYWRIPTQAQIKELIDNCYWEWTNSYNNTSVAGYIVYKAKSNADKGKIKNSKNKAPESPIPSYSLDDIHTFLPAVGERGLWSINDVGLQGMYRSSSEVNSSSNYLLSGLIMARSNISIYGNSNDYLVEQKTAQRALGMAIRPVLNKTN